MSKSYYKSQYTKQRGYRDTYHLTEEAENFLSKHKERYGDTMGIPCDSTYHLFYYPEKKTRKAWLEENYVDLFWVEYLFRPVPSINDLYVMRTYFKSEEEMKLFENWIQKRRTSVDEIYQQCKSNTDIHVEFNVDDDHYEFDDSYENMSEWSDESDTMKMILSPDLEEISEEYF